MSILPWLVIFVLVAVNALYVAAEFAAVAVHKSQLVPLARGGNRTAAGLLGVLGDGAKLDRYIAACQIGITLSSLVVGAFGQATIALDLGPVLQDAFGMAAASARSTAVIGVLLVLTALQLVFGELVPKSLALQFPERAALLTYHPTRISASLYRGFIWLLNGSGFLLLKPFGVTPGGHERVHSPEELAYLFAESRRGGELAPEAHRRLHRGLQLSGLSVMELMTPRRDLYAIDAATPPETFVRQIADSPFGRVPVYRESLDQILGTVSTKDVVGAYAVRGALPPLESLLRPIPFVPETMPAHRFVLYMQEKRRSKALVVDEFGSVQGIISIEDLLGRLFGEVGDELKKPEPDVIRQDDGSLRIAGSMGLAEAEPWLGKRWEGSAVTVAGHVLERIGRLPDEGESFDIDGVALTIVERDQTSVTWIVVHPPREEPPAEDAAPATDGEVDPA